MKPRCSAIVSAIVLAGSAAVAQAAGSMAVANLEPTKGNTASGKVTFKVQGAKVQVSGTISGLKPNAEHGFHVHEKGDCSSGDGMSAGGHFNPTGKPHGKHEGSPGHAGDLPNLRADANGSATFSFDSDLIAVGSGPADVIGKGLIVHRDPDDYKSQPAGNAGPRVACAVIVKS